MKRFFIVFWLWGLWAMVSEGLLVTPSYGDDNALSGGAAVQAVGQEDEASKVTVSKEDCAALTDLGRGAAYTPGVDVNGKPVVPADGGEAPSPFVVPQNIVIDFGVDIAKRYGLDALGYAATSKLWTVRLKDGTLSVDGKPLKKADSAAIAEACRRAYGP